MRREMMKFGSAEFCKEALHRGAPLKLRDDGPSMGRFFAEQCDYRELDNGDAFVQLGGYGYSWTQPTSRIGFKSSGAIQYNPDFMLDGGTMYAYFRPRNVQSTQFKADMVERTQQGALGAILTAPTQELATRIGGQIVSQELQRGFTVIRDDKDETDFGLGIIEKGKRPLHPFQVHGSDKISLANDWSEIHEQQREFLGPFEIEESGRALYVTMSLDGVPAVDVLVLPRDMGTYWLKQYIAQPGVTPLPGAPLMGDVLPKGADWRRVVPLAKGSYFLVVDNTSSAGPVSPPPGQPGVLGSGDSAAVVRYVVQVGDAP
jgi:hypothetical protein